MKGSIGSKTLIFIVSSLLGFSSAFAGSKKIAPKVQYSISDTALKALPSPFAPLTSDEQKKTWATEYQIAKGFAKNLDLYRAITTFQRASFLASESSQDRHLEIHYNILLSYYLGKRYNEIDQFISKSPLAKVSPAFPAYHDLLVILYDTKNQLGLVEEAEVLLSYIENFYPDTSATLKTSYLLQTAEIETLQNSKDPKIQRLIHTYNIHKKSPTLAATLNALVPGAGYFYLGQIHTAITALLVNALFIGAIITFFKRKLIALAIIFLSFEIGWYGGGIYGATGEGKYYNERVYQQIANPIMNQNNYFPIHLLKYAY